MTLVTLADSYNWRRAPVDYSAGWLNTEHQSIDRAFAANNGVPSISGSPEGLVSSQVGGMVVQSDAVGGPLLWRKLKGSDPYGWEALQDPPRLLLPTPAPAYKAYGDSFTVGQGASATAHSYVQIITARLGAAITNFGFGGTGALYANVQAFKETVPRISGFSTIMAGFNDVRRGGTATKTINKIKNCHRSMLASLFAASAVAADDISITKTGVWSTFVYAGKANALGGNALTASVGSTMTATTTGDSCVIGYLTSDELTFFYGPATVSVDGTIVATIDPRNGADGIADSFGYTNAVVPGALVLTGLGSGSHTILVSPTSGVIFAVDWIGTLLQPQECAPVLVAAIPRMPSGGYSQAPSLASDSAMAVASGAIGDVVGEFVEFPARMVFPNSRYDLTSGVNPDLIHPNDVGHLEIAESILAKIVPGSGAPLDISTAGVAQTAHLGASSTATAGAATSYGDTARATATNTVAIGANANVSAASAVGVGSGVIDSGINSVVVGYLASNDQQDGTVIGKSAAVSGGASSTALGSGAAASSSNATALGQGTVASADRTLAVGTQSTASAARSTALGVQASAIHADSTAVGELAATTAINQVMLGRATETVTSLGDVALGGVGKTIGFYGATPVARATAITAPTAPSAGYVQAEAQSMKTAVDAIRVALTNIGITL